MRRLESADNVTHGPACEIKSMRRQFRILTLQNKLIRIGESIRIMARNTYNVNNSFLNHVFPHGLVFYSLVHMNQTTTGIIMFVIFQFERMHGVDADIELAIIR